MKVMAKDKLEKIIIEALDGKLRVLVEVCNCQGDRHFLARQLAEEIINNQPEWTKEWPSEPGFYWFYGRLGKRYLPPELHFIKTHPTQVSREGRITFIAEGISFWRESNIDGYWMPADLPSPPVFGDD